MSKIKSMEENLAVMNARLDVFTMSKYDIKHLKEFEYIEKNVKELVYVSLQHLISLTKSDIDGITKLQTRILGEKKRFNENTFNLSPVLMLAHETH